MYPNQDSCNRLQPIGSTVSGNYPLTNHTGSDTPRVASVVENEIQGLFAQTDNLPLMYPAGTNPSEQTKFRAWSTPTSMRNVDSTCDAIVINEYINIDN